MRVRIEELQAPGLIVKPRLGRAFTIAYGEILTAERLPSGRGLRLHTLTTDPVTVACGSGQLAATERGLRARGVRVVDRWGAILTSSLEEFEAELSSHPSGVRQSSDDARR